MKHRPILKLPASRASVNKQAMGNRVSLEAGMSGNRNVLAQLG